jgi:hypothetical protein
MLGEPNTQFSAFFFTGKVKTFSPCAAVYMPLCPKQVSSSKGKKLKCCQQLQMGHFTFRVPCKLSRNQCHLVTQVYDFNGL